MFELGIALAATITLSTQEPEGPWAIDNYSQSMDVRGSAHQDYQYTAIRVSTTDDSVPKISFSCSPRFGIAATLFLTPTDSLKNVKTGRTKERYQAVKRSVKTADINAMMPFTWFRNRNVLQTRNHKTAARLYNAVVLDQTFIVDDVEFDPPPADQVFKTFADVCTKIREAE